MTHKMVLSGRSGVVDIVVDPGSRDRDISILGTAGPLTVRLAVRALQSALDAVLAATPHESDAGCEVPGAVGEFHEDGTFHPLSADLEAFAREVTDMGMHLCGCGVGVVPNGDPDWRHCPLDVREGDDGNGQLWMSEKV